MALELAEQGIAILLGPCRRGAGRSPRSVHGWLPEVFSPRRSQSRKTWRGSDLVGAGERAGRGDPELCVRRFRWPVGEAVSAVLGKTLSDLRSIPSVAGHSGS